MRRSTHWRLLSWVFCRTFWVAGSMACSFRHWVEWVPPNESRVRGGEGFFCGVRVLSGFDKQLRCQILQWDTGVAWTKHGVITNCHSYRKDTSGLNLIWIMLFSSCLRLVAKSRMAQLERLWWMHVVVPSLEWRHCLFVRLSFHRLSVLLSVRLAVSSFLCFPPFLDATFKDN